MLYLTKNPKCLCYVSHESLSMFQSTVHIIKHAHIQLFYKQYL